MPRHIIDKDRTSIASIQRSNGAWLIHFTGPGWDDRTEDENFDCASSLPRAKKIVREFFSSLKEEGEIEGPYRWHDAYGDGRLWWFEATVVDEWDRYEDDEL